MLHTWRRPDKCVKRPVYLRVVAVRSGQVSSGIPHGSVDRAAFVPRNYVFGTCGAPPAESLDTSSARSLSDTDPSCLLCYSSDRVSFAAFHAPSLPQLLLPFEWHFSINPFGIIVKYSFFLCILSTARFTEIIAILLVHFYSCRFLFKFSEKFVHLRCFFSSFPKSYYLTIFYL